MDHVPCKNTSGLHWKLLSMSYLLYSILKCSRNEHDLTREPLPAMVRTRPLDSSKASKRTLVKSEFAKTRPEDPPVTASVFGESNEVLGSSSGH